ncbi:MAG TPA: hypothetical protein PKD85_09200 [Saprospiraceae bacterium]|nr:hypothetical protein [Saprospiraceae bacterium]
MIKIILRRIIVLAHIKQKNNINKISPINFNNLYIFDPMSELKSRLEHILREVDTLCNINKQLKNEILLLKKELSELKNEAKLEDFKSKKLKHNDITKDDIDTILTEVNECIEMVKAMA